MFPTLSLFIYAVDFLSLYASYSMRVHKYEYVYGYYYVFCRILKRTSVNQLYNNVLLNTLMSI